MEEKQYLPPKPTRWNKLGVEQVASLFADKLNFGIGDPIEPVVKKLKGELQYGWNSFDEIDGGSIQADSLNKFTIFVSELTSPKRDRFTIAHELGHLILHLQMIKKDEPDAGMRATRHVDSSNESLQRAEWEANWFAAQLLMPRVEFKKCVDTFGVEHAAKVFNVSAKAAEIRAQSLE